MAEAAPSPLLQRQLAFVQQMASDIGCSPLVMASGIGRDELVAHLLRASGGSGDAGGNSASREDCLAAFLEAITQGHPQCLRALLAASPRASAAQLVQTPGKQGRTPLMHAALLGRVECMEVILAAHDPDAQVTARSSNGWDALMYAAHYGSLEGIALLLRHSPDAQLAAAIQSGNALAWAAMGAHLSCLRLLLSHGPQLQRLDAALGWAVREWAWVQEQRREAGAAGEPALVGLYWRCVELLLSKGAMLNVQAAPMLTGQAAPEAFALVRRVVQDLAARALALDVANEAAAQALQDLTRREGLLFNADPAATAAPTEAGKLDVVPGPERKGRKRGHADGSDGSDSSSKRGR